VTKKSFASHRALVAVVIPSTNPSGTATIGVQTRCSTDVDRRVSLFSGIPPAHSTH